MKDYKKILEGVVNIISTTEKSDIGFANICSYIGENCPELKESEDERIIERIKKAVESYWSDEPLDEILSWLEKQGEQKSIDDLTQQEAMDIAVAKCFEQGEQKPVVIPKFRIGDIIKDTEDGEVFIIRTITKDKYIYTDDSFDWIKGQDKYELVEQKPAWSEEDENLFRCAIDAVREESKVRTDGCLDEEVGEMVTNWLKSLKERYTWKPSDEQMNALNDVISSRDIKYDVLSELWKDLMKLKDEK